MQSKLKSAARNKAVFMPKFVGRTQVTDSDLFLPVHSRVALDLSQSSALVKFHLHSIENAAQDT
ncbi:unnamed protein product [Clonostachys rhizophaga]|uniref:Uncharacterized protein n=1 Tax=Clonostachys rhizophaga TaxID=160324 RepID=A0A9N9YQX7_9HYPO|nr:unnamed protein product [Clonostachys rhizophaga]